MRDLERIGDGLEAVLRRLGMPAPFDLGRLVDEWAALAGEPWASRSIPVGLREGELVVEVLHGTDATLLKYQVDALLERLERGLGAPLVEAVRIRVAGPLRRR
jgi:predicted nucleic acid-binding Zn ribbon protein